MPEQTISTTTRSKISSTALRSPDWEVFSARLCTVLQGMQEDQYLILNVKSSNEFVQIAAQGSWGFRVETISNHYRDDQHQLNKKQQAWLVKRGWQSPTKNPEKSTPQDDPHGSPNYFLDVELPVDYEQLAGLVIDTFITVMGVSHPAWLTYESFDRQGNSIPMPELKMKQAKSDSQFNKDELPQRLQATLYGLTGLELDFDGDGDIGFDYNQTTIFARVLDDQPYVRLHSVLLKEVTPSLNVYQRMNALNCERGQLHLILSGDRVVAIQDVLVKPFNSSLVSRSVHEFSKGADELKAELVAEFNGNGEFVTPQQPAVH